ncbi:MAG: hypothetical protein QOF19_930, partial [Alphaproteobacteria bacterium]|nr:hypothetical protein [Alphaproteobacteria bacterium]
MRSRAWLGTVSSLAIAGYLLQSSSVLADSIGITSAVSNKVEGINGGAARSLAVGSELFLNESVRTGEGSNAQILLRDQTSVSVGPHSEVKLDKYVYNPKGGAGDVVLSATRGAFRFVSGVQQSSSYQIKTPAGTLGVRGTVFDIMVEGDKLTFILVQGSAFARLPGGRTVDISTKGSGFVLSRGGRQVRMQSWDTTKVNSNGNMHFPLYGPTYGQESTDRNNTDQAQNN